VALAALRSACPSRPCPRGVSTVHTLPAASAGAACLGWLPAPQTREMDLTARRLAGQAEGYVDPAAPALVHSGSERDSDGSSLPEPSDEESSASDFSAADSAENDGKRRRRRPAPAAAAVIAGSAARPPVQAQPVTAAQARPTAPGGAAAARPLAQAQARALAPAPAAAAQPVPPLRTGGKHGLPLRIFGLGAAERQKFAAARPPVSPRALPGRSLGPLRPVARPASAPLRPRPRLPPRSSWRGAVQERGWASGRPPATAGGLGTLGACCVLGRMNHASLRALCPCRHVCCCVAHACQVHGEPERGPASAQRGCGRQL